MYENDKTQSKKAKIVPLFVMVLGNVGEHTVLEINPLHFIKIHQNQSSGIAHINRMNNMH